MQTRQLGKTDLEITPIGLGTWAIGGGEWEMGWGQQDDQQSIETIRHAIDLGINWIDTAAVYGLGHSEEIVGQALEGRSERPYVFTKCSLVWNDKREVSNSLKPASLRQELENSLRRLKTETIDLYQVHWPNPDPEIEEGWSALAQFKKEGKVRYLGVSNFNVEQIKRAQKIAPVDSLQPPYSLVKPGVQDEILPYCKENDIGVIVYAPMMSGLLSGRMSKDRMEHLDKSDWRTRDEQFKEPRLSRNLALADLLTEIGYPHSMTAGNVAIAWTLNNPAVTGAIAGGRSPEQVDDTIPAAEFRLSESELTQIDNFLRENP